MSKIYIGIDPGLSKTGLAVINERDQILLTSLILVVPTPKQKRILKLEKRFEMVNYKLKQIKIRLEAILKEVIEKDNVDEVIVTMESFTYYSPGKKQARKMLNYVYETIAGITMTKCVLITVGLKWREIQAAQLKRVITLLADGIPTTKVSKEELQEKVTLLLGKNQVEKALFQYAKTHREHIADALGICKASRHFSEYQRYIKLSPKKRKDWKLVDNNDNDGDGII